MDMNKPQKPYELEGIPLGSAKIKILKTKQGVYGLHGQTGWDDTPYWEFKDALIVTSQAYGDIDWGPFKQRKNSKKEHRGTSQINILEAEILRDENEAQEKSLNLAITLEEKRFEIEIEEGEDYEPRILKTHYKLDILLEDFIEKQFHPKLEEVYLKDN